MGPKKYALSADNCTIRRTHFANYVAYLTSTGTLYLPAHYQEGCAIELFFAVLKSKLHQYIITGKDDCLSLIKQS